MTGRLYKDDSGHRFIVDAKTDLADATSVVFQVLKPGGTEVEWGASVIDDASDHAEYITQENDLNESGLYKLHIYAVFGGSGDFHGKSVSFTVYDKFG